MASKQPVEYEMWHDEYKCPDTGFYIHGILLVPANTKSAVEDILQQIRSEFGYDLKDKCAFSGSLSSNLRSQLLRNQLKAGSRFLHTNPTDEDTNLYRLDGKGKYEATQGEKQDPFATIPGTESFGLRMKLLLVPENHTGMYGHDHAAKIETTLRFGLKGLCHLSFDNNNPIVIRNLHFDGYQHYQRNLNLNRIIGPKEWNSYVQINPSDIILDARQRSNRLDNSALFIDFVDAMIGGLYNKMYSSRDDLNGALQPLSDIEDRLRDNLIIINPNGRWHKSISVSEIHPTGEDDNPFVFRQAQFPKNPNQATLGL